MTRDRSKLALLGLIGASTGLAAGVWLWQQRRGARRRAAPPGWRTQDGIESARDALAADPDLAHRSIRIDPIGDGVIELYGTVDTHEESDRAVDITRRTSGAYTVVNRLTVGDEETHREEIRRRWQDGAPELHERQHYGMGVGMGRRRQSWATDPDRPSDKADMVDRELDVGNIERQRDRPSPDLNAASRVEAESAKPGIERAIEEAGLARERVPDRPGAENRDRAGRGTEPVEKKGEAGFEAD